MKNKREKFFSNLRIIDTSTVYPILLCILARPDVVEEEILKTFKALESYLVRRMLCNLTNKNYNKLFLGILKDLKKFDGVYTADVIEDLLKKQDRDSNKWPSDREFEAAWMSSPSYEHGASFIQMILLAIDESLRTNRREDIDVNSKLTIEHVLPQSWHENYAINYTTHNLAKPDESMDDFRNRIIHTIGNLTLLTHKLNSALQNDKFCIKKIKITANSALQLNAYFQSLDTWDEDQINNRGAALFEEALKIWPKP
jgi:hypothetical protein